MDRTDAAAEASLAAMRERIRFGIAIAAMIRMIATTINNSISEKPCCFCIALPFLPALSRRPRGLSPRGDVKVVACGGPSRGDSLPRLQSGQPLYFQSDV